MDETQEFHYFGHPNWTICRLLSWISTIATLIILVSMRMLPLKVNLVSSEAMVASKQPQRSSDRGINSLHFSNSFSIIHNTSVPIIVPRHKPLNCQFDCCTKFQVFKWHQWHRKGNYSLWLGHGCLGEISFSDLIKMPTKSCLNFEIGVTMKVWLLSVVLQGMPTWRSAMRGWRRHQIRFTFLSLLKVHNLWWKLAAL